jgi:uracil-DNA glycosylase family 4
MSPPKSRERVHFHTAEALSQYHELVRDWAGCQKCGLAKTRKRIVNFRGHLPCTIFLVGEGPGESEDAIGVPFIGEAGNLLNSLIERAYFQAGFGGTIDEPIVTNSEIGITNVVACLPCRETEYSPVIRPPNKQEADACRPRLERLIEIASPKIIVCLGQVATRYVNKIKKTMTMASLLHPSAILRMENDNPRDAELAEKRWILAMAKIMRETNTSH